MGILVLDVSLSHVNARLVLKSIQFVSNSDSTLSATDGRDIHFFMTTDLIGVAAHVYSLYCVYEVDSMSMATSDCNYIIGLI